MKNIYQNGTYFLNNPGLHSEHSEWKAEQIIKMLKRNNLDPAAVAEAGCGAGEILNQLRVKTGKDKSFSGFEISEDAINICRVKEQPNLKFYLKDILEEAENSFDLVLCIDVFEHVPDYLVFLEKLKRVGTYKLFHIPLDISVQTVLRSKPILKERMQYGHLHYFTKDLAIELMKDLDYEIIDYFYTPWSLELPDRTIRHRLMSIPRKFLFMLDADLAVRILGGYSLMVLAK